jgi:hypothetical protein
MADAQSPGEQPVFPGAPRSAWLWVREGAPCTLLLLVSGVALTARLVLPEQLSTHAGRWLLYVVCLQAAFGAFWEFVEGFVWERRRSYARGTGLLLAATTLYALAS